MKYFVYIIKHKLAIMKLWYKHDTLVPLHRVLLHDVDKLFMLIIINKSKVTEIHRKRAGHHTIKSDADFHEAYLDWASARLTKPDKPLDAIQTAEKFYPELLNRSLEHYKSVNYK